MRIKRLLLIIFLLVGCVLPSRAISFSLDSIATWGKFPRFCVNTYRWGDQFFNGYDTTYVTGTGYKFNVKAKSNSWIDYYNFDLPNNMRMRMTSQPSTSAGLWLTYMAVSVGYDKNFSNLFGWTDHAKQQLSFEFNCSLFACNLYYIDNKSGMQISKFGRRGATFNPDITFHGATSTVFGLDAYYFFNHKKYSIGAAFSFSRLQHKSQGSFFAGFSYSNQDWKFDFSGLPDYMKAPLPDNWVDDIYTARTRNYAAKFGYGYNWVVAPNLCVCFLGSPVFGLKKGYINNPNIEKNTFALSSVAKLSVVWNHKRWFAGLVGNINFDLIYDKDSTFENGTGSITISAGYRFNLW